MADCEICYRQVARRRRVEGKLVCWGCASQLCLSKVQLAKDKVRLQGELDRIKANPVYAVSSKKPYPYNHPISAVPPLDVLKRAVLALNLTGFYTPFSKVLGDHYGFQGPPYWKDGDEVPNGWIACYYPSRNAVYQRAPIGEETGFHEFWHALEAHGLVARTADSEENASLYARACLQRLKEAH